MRARGQSKECNVEDVLRNGKDSKYGGTCLCSFDFFSEVSQRESMTSHPQFYTTSVRHPGKTIISPLTLRSIAYLTC